jgi:hypothetical protein
LAKQRGFEGHSAQDTRTPTFAGGEGDSHTESPIILIL